MVHRLIGHAGAERAVTDRGDRLARRIAELVGDCEAERGRDGRRAMGSAEWVVLALGAAGEAAEPPALPKRSDTIAPPGDNLVRIGLVADIPDQPGTRRVEHIVK